MTTHPHSELARLMAGIEADAREKAAETTEEPPAHPLTSDASWFYSDADESNADHRRSAFCNP